MKKGKPRRRRSTSGAKSRPARGSSRPPREGEPGVAGFRSPATAYDFGEASLIEGIQPAGRPQVPVARASPPALRSLEQHGYSQDEIFALVVPKRTYARRIKRRQPLTVADT